MQENKGVFFGTHCTFVFHHRLLVTVVTIT